MKNHINSEDNSEIIEASDKSTATSSNDVITEIKTKPDDDHTLCKMCKLRCGSKKKLETHMKSHKADNTYDMSNLQDAIQMQSNISPALKCYKCEKVFKEKNELRKHIKSKHPSFKPCKNFTAGKRCEFGARCDYHHVILAEGTFICWDCGHMFLDKKELMVHRKQAHGINIACKKFLEGDCDRSAEACWYSHIQRETPSVTVNPQDFPKLPQNKTKPTPTSIVIDQPEIHIKGPLATKQAQTNNGNTTTQGDQTQKMLLEIVKLIQNQNKAIMTMMAQMCQSQSQS